jgi:hypothetical protein
VWPEIIRPETGKTLYDHRNGLHGSIKFWEFLFEDLRTVGFSGSTYLDEAIGVFKVKSSSCTEA